MNKNIFEFAMFFIVIASLFLTQAGFSQAVVTGQMKVWYPVNVTIDGPNVDESESTFRNYRLDVTFTKGTKTFKVPGFFAADGNAAESSATTGNKWRAIFTPDEAGTWTYTASLRTGTDIATSLVAISGTPTTGDGSNGSFVINNSSSNEPGFFAKGKLGYVGEHYGQFAGNKEWYVKAGPGSPEDFFGYHEFDNTVDGPNHSSTTQAYDKYLVNGLHQFAPHVADWKAGDPTWKAGKGKGIIGALNYISSTGANSLYIIPFTIGDDSDNTWPWTARDSQMSYDVSKLAQWDIVFSHMDKVGIAPLYYFCESDNSKLLDNASMILKNPIYYREIIARFGYHLGIRFNLGEELKLDCAQQKAASQRFKDLDPYHTIICGHSSHVRTSQVSLFECLLGDENYDGPNYQLHEKDKKDHLDLIMWRDKSAAAGKKWIVANDESWGIDNTTGGSGEGRMLTYTWRTFMAGAEGMVQYTAYGDTSIGDITMENFRLIENTQKILISAKNLFQKPEINPFLHQMRNENALVGNPSGNDAPFCFAKKGQLYIVYRTSATNQKPLDLSVETGTFTVKWYNANSGGNFQDGSKTTVPGGASVDLGTPPSNPTAAWAVIVYKSQCAVSKNIQVSQSGCTGVSTSGSGTYCVGNSASVTAIPGSTCKFENWTENGVVVSAANPYTFIISADRQLVANFSGILIPRYTISTSSNPSTGGSTSGSGVFDKGTQINLVATPESCFVFNNWTENGVVVSTNSSYQFTATKTVDLVANFSAKVFNVQAEPALGGTLSGELTYGCYDVIHVKATENPGYKFDGWYANNVLLATLPEDDINISSAFQLRAKFSLINPINKDVTNLTGWVSGIDNPKAAGSNRLMVVMVMGESSGDFAVNSVTYGGKSMTKQTDRINFTTGNRTYASIFTLNEVGVNAATSGAIVVNWNVIPTSGNSISSVLLGNVDQNTPINAVANNGLVGSNISILSNVAAANGDMVVMCGATENNITQTFNNGFIKEFESNSTWGDGVSGYKMGTGVNETPSFTQSANGRMVICALVAKRAATLSTDIVNITKNTISIYPNPTSGIINIDFPDGENNREIKVFNMVGQLVHSVKTSNSSVQLDVKSLNVKGNLILQVFDGKEVSNHKIIVK